MRIIAGRFRGRKLKDLKADGVRPTLDRVRENLFNIISQDVRDSIFLDLFAGSGAIGLEFLSRGAQKVVLCDNSKDAMAVIKRNIEKTHMDKKVQTVNADFNTCLEKVKNQKFDII